MNTKEGGRISRRRLLGSGAAAGTGVLIGTTSSAQAKTRHGKKSPSSTRTADVCVIGAGLAGLTAARTLHQAGKSVIVLEARDRVGGRCYSRSINASDVGNMGATFVGPTQTRVLALMAELGISKFPVYSEGELLWYENGKLSPYTGTIPPASNPVAFLQLGVQTLPQIDSMASTVPLDAPYNAPNAVEWDSMTVQTWAEQNILTADGQKLFALSVEAVLSMEPRDVSLLYFLWYIHSAGSVEVLIGNAGTGAAQDFRVTGGTQVIAIKMAQQLGPGNRVLLENPVRSIAQDTHGANVTADHVTVACKQVVVAIPPNLAGKIDYSPGVTAQRMQLTQRMPTGSLIKTIAVYETPFWRARGLNGQVTSDQGPVKATFDASPESGTPGVLLGFIDGDDARTLSDKPATERARAALESHVRYFGQRAANPSQYIDHVWDHEIYTGGCPVGVTPPGVLIEYGPALRAPIGRIHWAGTETATVWAGYMDGAIQSGQRAASEVLAEL